MRTAHEQSGWSFYGAWVLLGTLSLVVGIYFAFTTMWSVGERLEPALG